MSGPIVRSGATPEFSRNWDQIFAKKKKTTKAAGKTKTAKAKKKTRKK